VRPRGRPRKKATTWSRCLCNLSRQSPPQEADPTAWIGLGGGRYFSYRPARKVNGIPSTPGQQSDVHAGREILEEKPSMAFRAAKLLEPLPYGRAARRSARSMSGRADKRGQAKCRPACQASSSIDGELLSPPQAYAILTSAAAASCFPAAKLPMGASWTGARQKQLVLQTCTAPGDEAALWAAMRTAGLHPCSSPQLLSELPHLAGRRGASTDELQAWNPLLPGRRRGSPPADAGAVHRAG